MDLSEMRKMFNKNIKSIISTKRDDNKSFLSLSEYKARLKEVKQSKNILQTPKSKKTMKDYRLVRKYNVITIDGKTHLVKPNDNDQILYYVANENLFDVLHASHIAIGHGGRNRMVADLKIKYANITKEAVMVYLRLCEVCQKKSSLKRAYLNNLNRNINKSDETKNDFKSEFNCRAQIEIIDMQNQSYDGFNFILSHQDHYTKFISLRPLMSKQADEIADNLIDIYCTFGPPLFLHSKDGKDFITPILQKLHLMWGDLKIIIGEQNMNLTSANADITEKLAWWMARSESQDWPLGIKFTQYEMNCEHREDIGKSPYEMLFRRAPYLLPQDNLSLAKDIKLEFPTSQLTIDQHEESEEEQSESKLRNYMLAEHCETVMDGQF